MLPKVAVSVVEAVREPVTAVLPVALPIRTAPVPPVPIVVIADPVTLMLVVPATVRVPGKTSVEERAKAIEEPEPEVAIWFAVPERVMLPKEGLIAPPASPVKVCSPEPAPVMATHVATPFCLEVRMKTVVVPKLDQRSKTW
jgi:hypothetical protein